jgi:hypothetical protein
MKQICPFSLKDGRTYKDLVYDKKTHCLKALCWDVATQSWKSSTLCLDEHIGIVNGVLTFGGKNFSGRCHKIHFDHENGHCLKVTCNRNDHGDDCDEFESQLCLDGHLQVINGELCFSKYSFVDLSVMMSEVPWMKFKIVAEPDVSVFRTNPAVQQTIEHISSLAVEHVSHYMRTEINKRIEEVMAKVTVDTMNFIKATLIHSPAYAAHVVSSSSHATDLYRLHSHHHEHAHHHHSPHHYEHAHHHKHAEPVTY